MTLAIFDLDNTLIAGDSDSAWVDFLVARGIGKTDAAKRNEQFYRDYTAGNLNIDKWLGFCLNLIAAVPMNELLSLRREFMAQIVNPMMIPEAVTLIEQHRQRGNQCVIVTSTNRFVAEPIAAELGIEQLLATNPVIEAGQFTGSYHRPACFGEHKLTHLHNWCRQRQLNLDDSIGYSDSINDLPLLSAVTEAVAVDPDPQLLTAAQQRGWRIISLRGGPVPG